MNGSTTTHLQQRLILAILLVAIAGIIIILPFTSQLKNKNLLENHDDRGRTGRRLQGVMGNQEGGGLLRLDPKTVELKVQGTYDYDNNIMVYNPPNDSGLVLHHPLLHPPQQQQDEAQQLQQPCQLLPEVPDDLSWIKVPMDERGDQCSSHAEGINLKRCCIGQCRESKQKINSDQHEYEGLFLKPEMPALAGSAQSMLEYLHYFVQQRNLERINRKFVMSRVERMNNKSLGGRAPPIDTCVLWYVGQSLSQDQASAAVCKLTSLGYEIPNKKKCDINDNDGLLDGTCELTSQSSQYCPKIRVRHTYSHAGWKRKRHSYLDEAGPIIYNYGVHANSLEAFDEWMETMFKADDLQAIDQVGRYPFMWREHEPQHFTTKDGTWGGQASQCQDVGVYNNYRNEAAIRFFEKNGLLGKISVIKSFNALRPLSGFHLGVGDCTHYCYSPWRFDLTWHGIALGLQILPEQQNACMQSHNVDVDAQG